MRSYSLTTDLSVVVRPGGVHLQVQLVPAHGVHRIVVQLREITHVQQGGNLHLIDDLGEHARQGSGDELQLRPVVTARREAVRCGRQPQHLAAQHGEELPVHPLLGVDQVALVDDDVPEVQEQLRMVTDAADGGERNPRNVLPPERGGVDGAVQHTVGAQLQVVLLQNLLRGLEHQRMPLQPAGDVGNHEALSRPGGQHHDGVPLHLLVAEEADGGVAGLLLVVT